MPEGSVALQGDSRSEERLHVGQGAVVGVALEVEASAQQVVHVDLLHHAGSDSLSKVCGRVLCSGVLSLLL